MNVNKTVLGYSSENGIYVGLYLSLMSACLMWSIYFPSSILLIFPLACGVPVLVYYLMWRMYKSDVRYRRFSSLWAMGVFTFLFGALLCGVLTAGYILLFEPEFVSKYMQNAVAVMESSPVSSEYSIEINTLKKALDAGACPRPMQFVLAMLWTTAFFGSMLSVIMALLVNYFGKNKIRTENN